MIQFNGLGVKIKTNNFIQKLWLLFIRKEVRDFSLDLILHHAYNIRPYFSYGDFIIVTKALAVHEIQQTISI